MAVYPTHETWNAFDHYAESCFLPHDPILNDVLSASAHAGLPPHHVSPVQGQWLMLLAQAIGAKKILEIGTLGGYSAICLARALPSGGRLVTLEADSKHAAIARSNFARAGVSDRIDLRLGPALETLPKLASQGPFDLVFVDADKPNNPDYFAWALKLSRRGSIIVFDNVVRNGDVLDAGSPDAKVQGIRRLFDLLSKEPRVKATAMQTVGIKGYDGFCLALVIAD